MKEIIRGLSKGKSSDGITVLRCHYSADPERDPALNPQWKESERKKYTSQAAWDREQEIVHSAGGGERLFADTLLQWGHKIIVDPKESGFQLSPHWRKIGGFDSGKANPTAALSGCVDDDGTIYICCEYYQPGLSPQQHVPMLRSLRGFLEADVYADPTIFYENQAQADGRFKAIASLYAEAGIECLIPAPERHELLGMERILAHWHDLENREPTLKILCPRKYQNIALPIYGRHNEGCPNLLWELRRARREESSAAQLVNKNPSERIVDKDNHLRDCLKYICLALPEPAEKTFEQRVREEVRSLAEVGDLTSAYIRHQQMMAEQEYGSGRPIRIGRYIPRRSR